MFLGLEPADGGAGTVLFIRFSVIGFLLNQGLAGKSRTGGTGETSSS
jgi:hypothetical protein